MAVRLSVEERQQGGAGVPIAYRKAAIYPEGRAGEPIVFSGVALTNGV
jgi:hypothetical protein